MSWPDDLRQWAERLVQDETAIRAVNWRARDPDRAIEALQRALACYAQRLYDRRQDGQDYEWFRGVVCWKARNLLIDEFRSRRLTRQLTAEEELPGRENTSSSIRQIALLREVMAELPADEQCWLRLRSQGLTLAEIAAQEGCSAGTIHRRLQNPLRRLRERLLELDCDLFGEFL
jgi:RNA polymerase sigma factor (sigma-70 family)